MVVKQYRFVNWNRTHHGEVAYLFISALYGQILLRSSNQASIKQALRKQSLYNPYHVKL